MSDTTTTRYRVERQIGRGGMATVWRAHDTVLDRPVALKRLRPSLLDDQEAVDRFRREAETVARLAHPGLVHLLDRGEDDEGPFLVMELVDGEDLKTRIRRDGALEPREAARICADVARALDHAHHNGIVHRDIKSQNVLITSEGVAKLTDFGIARLIEGQHDAGLTRTGMLVGSSDYLAPEQAEGRPIDGRTDVYSLGIVLWECLTGKLPFPADSFLGVAMRHVSDPLPDPRTLRPDVPSHIAACTMRAAAKDPNHRFDSAARFARALMETDSGDTASFTMPPEMDLSQSDTQRHRRPARRGRSLTGLAILMGLLIVAAGVYVGYRVLTEDNAPPVQSEPTPRALTIRDVTSFDPQGEGEEQPGLVSNATDGSLASAWQTERYQDTPAFGGLPKDGVGLRFTFQAGFRPTELTVSSGTPGATFEVHNAGSPPFTGPPLASGTLTAGTQTVPLAASSANSVILWITRLAPQPDAEGMYLADIQEVSAKGVPNRRG